MDEAEVKTRVDMVWVIVKRSLIPEHRSYDMGMRLLNGQFDKEGEIYAAEFLEFAAKLNHTDAMYNLGMCYRWGNGGVYADPETALQWFRKAAEKGHEQAKELVDRFDSESGKRILLLSAMSDADGFGVKWYKTKAGVEEYYRRAKSGDAECQYELGLQLSDPERLGPFRHNIKEAVYWYSEAAKSGMVDAMFNLANIYVNGTLGEPKDLVAAKQWYQKCADAGDAEAQQILNRKDMWE